MFILTIAVLLTVSLLGSMTYVYRFRGAVRYDSLSQYLRKGWPVFSPLNCLLYLFTRPHARAATPDLAAFPELAPLRANWRTIRDEVLELHRNRHFETCRDPGSSAYYDVGFRTFYKYGWSKFYLKWYGYTHASAQALCPQTVALLAGIPSINGAMFSVLPPGSQLTRHADPLACSLRYHLGLATPNADNCFINVDGQPYAWRDGEAFLFDETRLHFARNDSDEPRLILMCDVERPMRPLGRLINCAYKGLARLTVVPNLPGDRRGLANRVFAGLMPALTRSKALKQSHRRTYKLLKYTVNSLLALLITGSALGVIHLVRELLLSL